MAVVAIVAVRRGMVLVVWREEGVWEFASEAAVAGRRSSLGDVIGFVNHDLSFAVLA